MKTALAAPALVRSRVADYLELAKLRVATLVLFTVAAGGLLAGLKDGDGVILIHAVLATACVAAGASALNQLLERHTDALMQRTENRPLPSGRLHPAQVLAFGLSLGIGGLVYMAIAVRQPLAVLITALTFISYVWLYTPLKRVTTLNTLIGAIPGALPPVIGWTAVRGTMGPEAWAMFFILFFWQLPHFLAIAWIYRGDYARAGLQMLPVKDPTGHATALKMVGFCVALLLASLAPIFILRSSGLYLAGALLPLGAMFLAATLVFMRESSVTHARSVLRASLIYLPLLFAFLLLQSCSDDVLAPVLAFAW